MNCLGVVTIFVHKTGKINRCLTDVKYVFDCIIK